jgi:hypothetical protein
LHARLGGFNAKGTAAFKVDNLRDRMQLAYLYAAPNCGCNRAELELLVVEEPNPK